MKDATARIYMASRHYCALALISLFVIGGLPVMAQHDMSNMPGMGKPKTKSRPAPQRRRKPLRKKTVVQKRSTTRTQSGPSTVPSPTPTPPMENMPGMQMPATPPPAEPMHGMQMPIASPTPTPTRDSMPGMQMPSEQAPVVADPIFVDPDPQIANGPVMRLQDLEEMALKNSPTIAQAEAGIRAAEGRRIQAGLFPNPNIGYSMEEFVFKSPGESAKHGGFFEQSILLGGKLSKNRQVFAREKEQAELIAEAQRIRVLNSVRILYYEALGAQRLVELRYYLSGLALEATEITKELHNVGQADTPDQLEIEIDAQRAQIDLLHAQNEREEVWKSLAAMVNNPALKPTRLEGDLATGAPVLDEELIVSTFQNESPEIRIAKVGVERARAVLARARAQRTPDLTIGGGLDYNLDRFGPFVPNLGNQTKGFEGRLQVAMNLPIFNRNQGGIATAEAELGIAESELQRQQLALRTRLAAAFRQYRNAVQMEEKYRTEVVPRARAGYEMYLSNFRQMAASYPQVLIAQRTLFQVEVEYARALLQVRETAVGLRGFLLTGGLDPVGRPGDSVEGMRVTSPAMNDAPAINQ